MDEKDLKKIADRVASTLDSKSRLEPHDRAVTARECDVKHGQIMNALRTQTGKMEEVHKAQTGKMNEVHTDVRGMQEELSVTTGKINGHVNWHEGMKEEKSDAQIKKSQKTASLGNIAKWAAVVIAALALAGKLTWDSMKIHSLAEDVAMKVNGHEKKNP